MVGNSVLIYFFFFCKFICFMWCCIVCDGGGYLIFWWGGGVDGIFCYGLIIKRWVGKGELEDKWEGEVWVGWEYRVLDRVVYNIIYIYISYRDFFI